MSCTLLQKAVFRLVYGLFSLVGGLFETSPGAYGQGNVVALAADQPALAGRLVGGLPEFAVKLLNRPADAAFVAAAAGSQASTSLVRRLSVRWVDTSTRNTFNRCERLNRAAQVIIRPGWALRQ